MTDYIENLKNRTDPFSNFLGIQIDQVAEGYAKIRVNYPALKGEACSKKASL